MLLHFAMAENTLRKSIPYFPLSANAALTSRLGAPREGSYTPATRLELASRHPTTRLARSAAAPRHAHGHQNVPPARFSRCARALSSLVPRCIIPKRNTILSDGVSFCDFPPLLLSVNQLFLSCVSDNAQKTMYFNYLFSAASSCKIL